MVSNTFATPQAAKAINLARVDYNQSMLAIATNFYGPSLPTSADITILGAATAPSDGWMYRDSKNGVLYIKDSANAKGLSGDFTVNGIGSRIIENLSDFYGQEGNFELGELFKTVGSNARLYVKKANTTGDAAIADLGIPPENYSITRAMLGNAVVSGDVVTTNVSVTDRNEVHNGQREFLNNTFIVSNTDASATSGPDIQIYRNSASPADGDNAGRVIFLGKDSGGSNVNYGLIGSVLTDVTASEEDGEIYFQVINAGSLANVMNFRTGNVLIDSNVVLNGEANLYVDSEFGVYIDDTLSIHMNGKEHKLQQNFDSTTVSDSANISWNLDTQQVAEVVLAGNRYLDTPTNMRDGGTYILRVRQDSSGSRTITFSGDFKFPGGVAPTLTTDANALDILSFTSNGTSMFGVALLEMS